MNLIISKKKLDKSCNKVRAKPFHAITRIDTFWSVISENSWNTKEDKAKFMICISTIEKAHLGMVNSEKIKYLTLCLAEGIS